MLRRYPYCSAPTCGVHALLRKNKNESPLPEWNLQKSTLAVYRAHVQGAVEEYSLYVAGNKRADTRMTSTDNPIKVVITTNSLLKPVHLHWGMSHVLNSCGQYTADIMQTL